MYKAAIITVSDTVSAGKKIDTAGPAACEILEKHGYSVVEKELSPDEQAVISEIIKKCCRNDVHIVITLGGTGFSKRDVTPEATLDVIERRASGVAEAIRSYSMQFSKNAMLSRAEAGIKGETVIVNLPGSKKAACEILDYIAHPLKHGIDILTGRDVQCGETGEKR